MEETRFDTFESLWCQLVLGYKDAEINALKTNSGIWHKL